MVTTISDNIWHQSGFFDLAIEIVLLHRHQIIDPDVPFLTSGKDFPSQIWESGILNFGVADNEIQLRIITSHSIFISVSNMGDKEFSRSPLRKSVQDLLLGIDDVPIALPPEIVFCAAPINQMPWIWGLANACLGRILSLRMVHFQFTNADSVNLVFHCGPWSFNDIEEGRNIIPFRFRISDFKSVYGILMGYTTTLVCGSIRSETFSITD